MVMILAQFAAMMMMMMMKNAIYCSSLINAIHLVILLPMSPVSLLVWLFFGFLLCLVLCGLYMLLRSKSRRFF